MKITIKYFGATADASKSREERFDFEGSLLTVSELKSQLHDKYPQLQRITCSIAVNQQLAHETTVIVDGDLVALLPPFAGG